MNIYAYVIKTENREKIWTWEGVFKDEWCPRFYSPGPAETRKGAVYPFKVLPDNSVEANSAYEHAPYMIVFSTKPLEKCAEWVLMEFHRVNEIFDRVFKQYHPQTDDFTLAYDSSRNGKLCEDDPRYEMNWSNLGSLQYYGYFGFLVLNGGLREVYQKALHDLDTIRELLKPFIADGTLERLGLEIPDLGELDFDPPREPQA